MKKLSNTIVILFVIIFSLNQTVNAQARKKPKKTRKSGDTKLKLYKLEHREHT